MKKILVLSTLLIAVSLIFFWQCEKSELSDAGEITFKNLNGKVWYPEKMSVDGEEIYFSAQASLEFEKMKLIVKPNGQLTCMASITYPGSNHFSISDGFDCFINPVKFDPQLKRMMQLMENAEFDFKSAEHEAVFYNKNMKVTLKDSWIPVPAPFNFDNTHWLVTEMITAGKDISYVWETERPKLRFENSNFFMEIPKNNCTKPYVMNRARLILDDAFVCKITPCCGSDKNTLLSQNLSGEMYYRQPTREIMVLRNMVGTEIIMKRVPFNPPNEAPGEIE
jgi:hypothetical protein